MSLLLAGLSAFFFASWLFRRLTRRQRQYRYLATFPWPNHLERALVKHYPALSPPQRQDVLTGLRDFFGLCQDAGQRFVAMPSQAVDVAWHAFILDTRAYQRFCRHAYGRPLHHTPAEAMRTPTQAQDGIKRAWRLACSRERINPQTPDRLPRLFALDASLAIPDGFRYQLNCLAAASAGAASTGFCASHIGCSSSCGGSSGDSSSDSSGDGSSGGDGGGGGCGGGCGGGGD